MLRRKDTSRPAKLQQKSEGLPLNAARVQDHVEVLHGEEHDQVAGSEGSVCQGKEVKNDILTTIK